MVELPARPDRVPAAVLHGQCQLLQVPRVSVHEGRAHGFVFLRASLRLRGRPTRTPSWETNETIHNPNRDRLTVIITEQRAETFTLPVWLAATIGRRICPNKSRKPEAIFSRSGVHVIKIQQLLKCSRRATLRQAARHVLKQMKDFTRAVQVRIHRDMCSAIFDIQTTSGLFGATLEAAPTETTVGTMEVPRGFLNKNETLSNSIC